VEQSRNHRRGWKNLQRSRERSFEGGHPASKAERFEGLIERKRQGKFFKRALFIDQGGGEQPTEI